MGLRDIIEGMKNGPRGQRRPSSSGSGGGMSRIMMAPQWAAIAEIGMTRPIAPFVEAIDVVTGRERDEKRAQT